MQISTCMKRLASLLLAMAMMMPAMAAPPMAGPADFLTKQRKSQQKSPAQGKKMTPLMMRMQQNKVESQSIPNGTNLTRPLPRMNMQKAPLAVTESGAALYGNLIYSDDMSDYSTVGYYSIDANTGEYTPYALNEQLQGAGTVVDGVAYVSFAEQFWGMILGLYTVVYDVENGELIQVKEHSVESFASYAINMAYDYVGDEIYALTYNDDASDFTLSKLDRESVTYTKVADVTVSSEIFAMTFDASGVLYVMCVDGKVREMNPLTGEEVREVCDTGFKPQYMQSACWSPADDKILWAASNETESYILAIDVAAGTTETLCTFTKCEEWTSLYTTDPMASEDAPAAPNVEVSFSSPGALSGSITVTVPSKNVAGETLASEGLTLVVVANDVEIFNGAVEANSVKTLNNVDFIEGINGIKAYANNAAGRGLIASVKAYAGEDTPMPVSNLNVDIADNGKATLTWDAPTAGANGGYLNVSTLTYKVERSGEVVAENLTATTYVDQLPASMAAHQWTVTAYSREKASKPVSSDKILFGDALELPYAQTFDSESSLDVFTIVNVNEDDRTWIYDISENKLQYPYSSTKDADDYAFTPPLNLTNERMILVEVNAYSYSTTWPETLELTVGPTTDPADQTVILPATVLNWAVAKPMRAYFKVPTSGTYYVGIHAVSQADSYYLMVSDIKVEEGPAFDAPLAVSDAVATPGANGALNATLTFKAPTKSFDGKDLTGDVKVTAMRDGEVVGETTLAPGASGSIVDNNAVNGVNNYVLLSSNAAGDGDKVEVSCRCGEDAPSYVKNVKFTTSPDNISTTLSWEAPTEGMNGGYVDPSKLTYTIYIPSEDGYNVEFVDETTELSYDIMIDEETLQAYSFYVTAKNQVGESDLMGSIVMLGTPYQLPFEEKLVGTSLTNSPWLLDNNDPNSETTWEIGGVMENYNLPEAVVAPDGGMMICYDFWENAEGTCGLKAPKMNFAGAKAPTLYLSMYHYTTAADVNELSVLVTTDDANYENVFAKKVNAAAENGWVEYQVGLEKFKDAAWVGIELEGHIAADGFIFVDYVIVENASENDVMVEKFTAPLNTKLGETVEFTADVFNKGVHKADYKMAFYVGDELVGEESVTGLEPAATKSHKVEYVTVAENLGEAVVKAVVTQTNATDEVAANNEATAKMMVSQPYLRVVTDLAGTENEGTVTLTWSEPTLSPDPVVDNMEAYESFAIDGIGKYTIVDDDEKETYGIDGADFELANGPKAWQVWAPNEIGVTAATWAPYEGEKCLVAFSTVEGAASDWLISPEIIGGTELSFWAAIPTDQYGAETFEILYSTTDNNIESFELYTQEAKGVIGWQQYSYILPNNAKYFAIRYTSVDIFALLIDNLSYVDASTTVDLVLTGYNVYCNGEKVNETALSETTFDYVTKQGEEMAFNVTVLYDEGESLKSNTLNWVAGLDDVKSIGAKVYGQAKSIKVENVAGRMVSVYTTDGKLVGSVKATDSDVVIPVDRGVYVVKVDNSAVNKVQVR